MNSPCENHGTVHAQPHAPSVDGIAKVVKATPPATDIHVPQKVSVTRSSGRGAAA